MIDVMRYIQANFIYPKNQETIQTEFLVTFVINTKGYVTDVVVETGNGNYSLADKEMLRVVRTMPRWKPAKQAGVIVKQQFTLPIQLEVK